MELSHITFDNWVTKTVNFLRLEAEVGEADVIRLDLPLHWMAAVWVVSIWEAGCDVTFEGPADLTVGGQGPDVYVVADAFGMAPAPDVGADWYFPADVRGMPDALVLPPAPPGSVLGYTPAGLAVAATGYAEQVGLTTGGRLQVGSFPGDLSGVLALIGGALAVDAAVIYGPAHGEDVTATA